MTAPRIRIQGKTYKVPTIEDLTLDDIVVLDGELQERYRSSWAKVSQFVKETDGMTEADADAHPMSTLMGGVTVWMVLRVAGKKSITMQEALSIPLDSVEDVVIEAPKDRQPKRSRKSSAAAAGAGAAAKRSSPSRTSKKASASASRT